MLRLLLMLFCCTLWYTNCTNGPHIQRDNTYAEGFRKGINITPPASPRYSIRYSFGRHIDELFETGINTVFLVNRFYVKDERGSRFIDDPRTLSDSAMARYIQQLQDRDITVILKPHVDLLNQRPRFMLAPSDMNEWCRNYREIIDRYVQLSQSYQCSTLVVATELDKIVIRESFRNDIVSYLKKHYSGKLVYASSFDHFVVDELWQEYDYIGVNAWFNLCSANRCNQSQLSESWNYWLHRLQSFSVEVGKPIWITEVGYYSRTGCAINPGNWERKGAINFDEQRKCYEALLSQAGAFDAITGIYWWEWEIETTGGIDNADYTPQEKPAQEVIQHYWATH